MRFVLVVCLWVIVIGGLRWYYADRGPKNIPVREATASQVAVEDVFRLVLTPTFAAEPDPFALKVGDEAAGGLVVRVNGRQVAVPADSLRQGEPLVVEQLAGIQPGSNEIFVEASPPLAASGRSQAIRVQVIRAGQPLAEATFWGESGARVVGSLPFTLDAEVRHGH